MKLLSAALSAASIGCGGGMVPLPGARAQAEKIESLERHTEELQRRATVAEVEAARLRLEIIELEAALRAARKEAATAPQSPPAPTRYRPAAVARPEPPIDLGTDIEESELDEPIRPPPPPPSSPPPPPPASPAAPLSDAGQELYDRAYTLYHEQRYSEAETVFGQFLERYPTDELADNALFWIGESRFARGELEGALQAFSATVERYPDGNKVADSMFKAGRTLEAMGQTEGARDTYQVVEGRFPGTAAAALARERLAGLR